MKLTNRTLLVLSIFLVGLALRILLIPNPGFEADISFWKSWSLGAIDGGVKWSLYNTNNNYPVPFAYILLMMGKVYSVFADPHNFNQFWNTANVTFLTICKTPSILSDLGIGILILWFGKNRKSIGFPNLSSPLYFLLATLYLFNPVSLADGAWWGQVDSLGIFLFLLSLACVVSRKTFLGGFVFMVAMLTKLQNMIYAPLFFILIWQLYGFSGLIRGLAGALTGFLGLNIEFVLGKNMERVLLSLSDNYDYFPLLSLLAFNFWWIVSDAKGLTMTDKNLFLGLINAKTMGLILFSSGYLLAVLTMLKETIHNMMNNSNLKVGWGSPIEHPQSRKLPQQSFIIRVIRFLCGQKTFESGKEVQRDKDVGWGLTHKKVSQINYESLPILYRFFTALIIVNASFFLFQTQSHDRYAFPIIVFSLLWFSFYLFTTSTEKIRKVWWQARTFKIFIIVYILFSLLYFINLHTATVMNFPDNCISALIPLKNPIVTIAISYIFLFFFVFFLWVNRKLISTLNFFLSFLFCCFFLITLNLPLLTHRPVSLTKLTPYMSTQEYKPKFNINMPVNVNAKDSKTWNRLSVQYSFYQKGIGTHAKSYIGYDIGGYFKRFTVDMGIDTEAGGKASVIFKVYSNGNLLYESDVIKRYEYPRHAEVDVTGIKTLELVVDGTDDGITDDHADWLNPLLFP